MVHWHRRLCQSPNLAALPETAGVENQLEGFIAKVTARTMQLSDYRTLLASIVPALTATAAAIGANAALSPSIARLAVAATARAAEKAHGDFLIGLSPYA